MPTRTVSMTETAFLALAAAVGAAASGGSTSAIVGLPVAAASATALAYRGRSLFAAVALALGASIATAFSSPTAAGAVFAVPAIVAVLAAIVLLRRVSYRAVGGALIVVFTLAGFAVDAVVAAANGRTVSEQILWQSKVFAAALAQTLDPAQASEVAKQILELTKQTVTVLPSVYFIAGTFLAVAVLASVAWAAKRVGESVTVPPLELVDLPPIIVVGAAAGLISLAISRAASDARTWEAVGTNLLLCTGALLLVQGLAVYSAFLKRARVGTAGRVATYVALFILDAILRVVSLTGLADFWLNFRKLPREGKPELRIEGSPKDRVGDAPRDRDDAPKDRDDDAPTGV